MKRVIHNPREYQHMDSISCYNHNYYENTRTGEIILEDCDEEYGICSFYRVTPIGEEYLGECYWDEYEWNQEEDIVLFE